jgi:hypothetical protein
MSKRPPIEPFNITATEMALLQQEFQDRGVAVLREPALKPSVWQALLQEAMTQRGVRAWRLASAGRTGEIDQDNMRGYLDSTARELLASRAVQNFLLKVTGEKLEVSWSASCYTYYDEPGSYMGEHCDKADVCKTALLLYLDARWPDGGYPGPGLQLTVFRGDNSSTPLVARVTARSNRLVILNGGAQAHLRPPLGSGESLIMLAGCFKLYAGR